MPRKHAASRAEWNPQATTNLARRGVLSALRLVFLLLMCFVVLYPLIYMVSVSLRDPQDLYDPTIIWIPKNWTLDNYQTVWELIDYPQVLKNTAVMTLMATAINVAICAMVGYGFARFRFKGRNILFGLVLFTLMVPNPCSSSIIPSIF